MINPADLRDVFDRAASLPPQDRAAFLAQACGNNAALRQEVERLLAADQRAGSVFDSGSRGSDGGLEPRAAVRDDSAGLKPGARLGPYVIVGAAGHGGMGEVYRARDTRLDRIVALKVLPSDLVQDPAARRRFEREARAAAALSHPHICTLLDIGRQDETDFIVMEFVDGDTLAHHVARETPPLRESLRIGIEIAEALVAAHAAHIVHRDIKPGNVMLRPDGFVKVLDFGLAKLAPQIPTDGGDTTRALSTRAGLIVGTVAYMSPEQARGQEVDARTDIWSLGCVMYEMVGRRAPFAGTSTTDVLAAVLQSDPASLVAIDPTTPAELQRIVSKALRKDRRERYQTAQDLLIDLKSLRDTLTWPASQPAHHAPTAPLPSSWRNRTLAAAGVALVIAGGAVWWRVHSTSAPSPTPPQPVQRSLTRLTFDAGLQTDPTFSPDGRFIAYASDKAGNFDIWVQPVAGGDAVQVTKSPTQETQPAWSPDGSTIVFRSERDGGGLYLVPALGGSERLLVPEGIHPSWSADGTEVRYIVKAPTEGQAGLRSIPVTGGEPRWVLPEFLRTGSWLWIAGHPDGRVSFFGDRRGQGFGFFTVAADGTSVASRFIEHLPPQLAGFTDETWDVYGRHFHWNPDGHSLVLETMAVGGVSNLWKVTVDPNTLAWTAFERLTTGPGADSNAQFDPAGTRVAFTTLQKSDRIWQFPLHQGQLALAAGKPLTEDNANAAYLSVTADGRDAVFNLQRLGSPDALTLWLEHLDSGRLERLESSGASARLSPNRQKVAYTNGKRDKGFAVFVQKLGGGETQIMPWSPAWVAPCDWAPDGSAVLVSHRRLEAWPVDPNLSKSMRVVLEDGQDPLFQGKYSPNGQWLAFVAAGLHSARVGVTPADGSPTRHWTAIDPNHRWTDKPRWSPDGRRLYFLAQEGSLLNLWATDFDQLHGVAIGTPFRVAAFSSPAFRIDPEIAFTEMDVSTRFVFLTMRKSVGNIWMLDNVDR